MAGQRGERPRIAEASEIAPVELRAVREIGHACKRRVAPRRDDPLRAGFGQPRNEAQAKTQEE